MKRLMAIFLVSLLLAAILAGAGLWLASRAAQDSGTTLLVWRLSGPLVEQAGQEGLALPGMPAVASFADVYSGLRAARDDVGVRGLAVYIENPVLGLAKAQELRRQFETLRAAGKFVECYMETAGELSNGTLPYFIATACDTVHMAPAGDLNLLGLYADAMFLRGTLDKLKIQPQIRAVGQYKSGAETYERESWSPAAREALEVVLDGYYEQIVQAIAERRELEPAAVRALFDRAPYTATEALEAGLLDSLAYPDQFRDHLKSRLGGEARRVSLPEYGRRRPGRGAKVAVVFGTGIILRGQGGSQPWTGASVVGSGSMSRLLRRLADDDAVRAVVLRIDSPGGSPLASDLILRELELLSEAKPLVVSMSDVAASGGYYIASRVDTIVAEAATLTGSIGVYGGKLATGQFESELLGITHDPITRGANAGIYSPQTAFTPDQEARIDRLLNRVYDTFLNHVAEGRDMARSEVEAIAQGRVWTGEDARQLGLVDEIGGLDRALEIAAEKAQLDPEKGIRLAFYPRPPGLLDWLVEQQKPSLPTELATVLKAFEKPSEGLLLLPPEIASISSSFGPENPH